jgi:hypothetical protein
LEVVHAPSISSVPGDDVAPGGCRSEPGGSDVQDHDAAFLHSAKRGRHPGTWRLTLVASFGSMTGQSVQGEMTLRGQDSLLRRVERPGSTVVTVPVIGAADIALEAVGARRIGDLQSLEPARPGLAIWVSHGADGGVSAVLRIGQEEIHPTLLQIEGAYTVLYLREVSSDAMRGGWASGVMQEEAHGHFCAERVLR